MSKLEGSLDWRELVIDKLDKVEKSQTKLLDDFQRFQLGVVADVTALRSKCGSEQAGCQAARLASKKNGNGQGKRNGTSQWFDFARTVVIALISALVAVATYGKVVWAPK